MMEISKASSRTKEFWEGIFHFDSEDAIYQDHFPEYPVVPGSMIVHAFLTALSDAGVAGGRLSLENFKFREFLKPGRYPFRIERLDNNLYCSISEGNRKLVTGVISR
jgi:3-hydroxyacyl-[acyl-carrier-protein] dehydratase